MSENIIYSATPEDFHYMDINIPCQSACPVQTNIPAYIRALFKEEYEKSYEINQMVNILPGVLGRICSRPCEDRCRHGEAELGKPVDICHIKRAAADYKDNRKHSIEPSLKLNKKVAIIGAGPSGLAAAHDLARFGFSVTIFEAMEKPGGMLMYGIPEFRLPRDILDSEIDAIMSLGITFKAGIRIGKDIMIKDLLSDYEAVLAAVGCYKSIPLDIPGETLDPVYSGLEFMMEVCSGNRPVIGERVLVIGAGFTAFDCARTSLRLGAKDVTICLRRIEEDLRVTNDEITETKTEGIKIKSLMLSRRILGDGKVEGVEFIRTQAGEKQRDGKRSITPIKGSEFFIETDTVIIAAGQRPKPFESPGDKDSNGLLRVEKGSFRTSVPKFYATGDYVTGPSTVIESISIGRKTAKSIMEDITGKIPYEKMIRQASTKKTDRSRTWDFLPRQEMPTLKPTEERFQSQNKEVETGYPQQLAREEAKRCYLCYLHYEIDISRCIYCRYCIDVAPRDCIKLVKNVRVNDKGGITGFEETTRWSSVNAIIIDNSRCIRCGECVRVCPMDCISVTKVECIEKLQ